jgi:hypothetical protein
MKNNFQTDCIILATRSTFGKSPGALHNGIENNDLDHLRGNFVSTRKPWSLEYTCLSVQFRNTRKEVTPQWDSKCSR